MRILHFELIFSYFLLLDVTFEAVIFSPIHTYFCHSALSHEMPYYLLRLETLFANRFDKKIFILFQAHIIVVPIAWDHEHTIRTDELLAVPQLCFHSSQLFELIF